MKIVATVEARMTSSRLPGKVLMLAGGKPMLEHLVTRLGLVQSVNEIVIATTENATDDVLADLANRMSIECYRGSEDDVMSRVLGAGESANADVIVEITGDCPILDPDIVEQTIRMFMSNECDYASNVHVPSYPIGMDAQVFRTETLGRSYSMTDDPLDREHVTRHMRQHPEIFRHVHLVAPPNLHWPDLSLALDEQSDYELITAIIEHFAPKNRVFRCDDIVKLLRKKKPQLLEINKDVVRRGMN